jgi:hypothetical protein
MSGDLPYRVSWLPEPVAAVKALVKRAAVSNGGRSKLAQVLRALEERLRHEPLTFGEVYRSRGPVEEHLAVHDFLAVDIAVDKARRFVLVRKCRALSGHG